MDKLKNTEDDKFAKALLLNQCCEECTSLFSMVGEDNNDMFFCGNDNALSNGYLLLFDGLKNRTLLTNTCEYFKDRRDCAAPMPYIFPIFEEQDEK